MKKKLNEEQIQKVRDLLRSAEGLGINGSMAFTMDQLLELKSIAPNDMAYEFALQEIYQLKHLNMVGKNTEEGEFSAAALKHFDERVAESNNAEDVSSKLAKQLDNMAKLVREASNKKEEE